MDTPPLRLAVVDNVVMVRHGLTSLLATWPHGRVVLSAANGVHYERACDKLPRIHIAVVGMDLPLQEGYRTIRWITRHQETTKPIAYAASPTESEVARMLRDGSRGVFCKHSTSEEDLLRGMDQLRRTGFYYNDLVSKALRRKVEDEAPTVEAVLRSITKREMEFLLLYARPPYPKLWEVAERMRLKLSGAEELRKTASARIQCPKREHMMDFMYLHGLR